MKLKHLLWAALTALAALPVLLLGIWVSNNALDREIAAVEEKHLLLARNITAALDRYAGDVEALFALFSRLAVDGNTDPRLQALADELGFGHVFVLDPAGRVLQQINGPKAEFDSVPHGVLVALTADAGPDIRFSPVVMNAAGVPTIFLTQRLDEQRLLMGALSTAYFVELQHAIAFGERGHAAIVDQTGQVIAHPNEGWRLEAKNIAKVDPVRRMINGETGVSRFFSPAMQADMISGFTTVSGPGWGVMVPQPIDELRAQAREVVKLAALVAAVGVGLAAILAWTVAGLIARPLQAIGMAVDQIRAGNGAARVRPLARPAAREVRDLAVCFNEMAEHVEGNRVLIQRSLEDAQAADNAKTEFLANMSHELRTPLNAIIGFSETMRMEMAGPLPNEQYRQYAGDINKSGNHLLDIINDILDLAKIEAGRLRLELEPVEVEPLVAGAVALIEKQAQKGRITIVRQMHADLPAVTTNAVKLKQILINLLSNAVKFSPQDSRIAVSAWVEPSGTFKLQVADEGIGMDEQQIKTALTPFGQLESAMARNFQGTGLGLPLAKGFAELLGGGLEIVSAPGRGTTVTVTLDRAAEARTRSAA